MVLQRGGFSPVFNHFFVAAIDTGNVLGLISAWSKHRMQKQEYQPWLRLEALVYRFLIGVGRMNICGENCTVKHPGGFVGMCPSRRVDQTQIFRCEHLVLPRTRSRTSKDSGSMELKLYMWMFAGVEIPSTGEKS